MNDVYKHFYRSLIPHMWVLPFFSFLIGYYCLSLLSGKRRMEAPTVLGLPLQEAIKVVSTYQLNVRILKEKEDKDMPEGIVISQSPEPHSRIKPHQSIFLVITRRPAKKEVPSFYGLTHAKAKLLAQKKAMPLKAYYLESSQPQETSIAQLPLPKLFLSDPTLILYISQGNSSIHIVPSFKDRQLSTVARFLKEAGMPYQVFRQPETGQLKDDAELNVIDQRPIAGSFIDFKKPVTLQLTVA